MSTIVTWFLTNLGQESTWRGMIQVATSLGVVVKPQLASYIVSVGLGLVGAINFLKNSGTK